MDNSASTEPPMVADLLLDEIDILEAQATPVDRARWPLLRDGERDAIPAVVRDLVKARDGRRCTLCGARERLQLDHITPWSALGSDRSDNLRTLCWSCNLTRSNFRETYLPRVIPVVAACDPCLSRHETDPRMYERHGRTNVWMGCPACRTGEWDTSDDRITAWCGTCEATSWTSDTRRLL